MVRVKLLALVFALLIALPSLTSCGGSVSANSLAILTNAITSAVQGSSYSATLQASGGTPPYSWSVTAGQLPTGVVFGSNGTISGVPTQSGTFNFTVSARDAKGGAASQALSLKVDGPLAITTTSLPQGTIAVAYNATLRASGGSTPYAWSLTSGSLPSGLTLNSSTGTISGTPAAAGNSNFTVRVTDAGGATQSANLTISISGLTITNTSLPNGVIGNAYQATLTASGGTAPYTWSVGAGSLPSGLSLASNGAISGTPTTASSYTFTVRVTDAAASTKTATFTVMINGLLAIATSSLPEAAVGYSYSATLQASGGIRPYTWSVSSGSLPAGLTLDASTGLISGTPSAAGSYSFGVQVQDSASTPALATRALTLTVTTNSSGFQYVLGDTWYPYSTQSKPAKGASFVDSTYHTTVTRVTDSFAENGHWSTITEYPTWDPSSADGKYLVFQTLTSVSASSAYTLYDGETLAFVRNLPFPDCDYQNAETRWDRTGNHPHWLLYRCGMKLHYFDVDTGVDGIIHNFEVDFPSYPESGHWFVHCHEYCSPSADGRYHAFVLENWDGSMPLAFVYDRTLDTVISQKSLGTYRPRGILMSPSGNYVIINWWYDGTGTEHDGQHSYNRDFTNPIKVTTGLPHINFGWSRQGHEVAVSMNESTDDVQAVRLDTGYVYRLYNSANMGYPDMLHTYMNVHGWAFMNTYGAHSSTYPTWASEGNPGPGQIFAFEIDETKCTNWWYSLQDRLNNGQNAQPCSGGLPRIWRVAFTDNIYTSYYQQVNLQANYAGTKLWFGSNWRNYSGASDVYQVTLPANWWVDLGSL